MCSRSTIRPGIGAGDAASGGLGGAPHPTPCHCTEEIAALWYIFDGGERGCQWGASQGSDGSTIESLNRGRVPPLLSNTGASNGRLLRRRRVDPFVRRLCRAARVRIPHGYFFFVSIRTTPDKEVEQQLLYTSDRRLLAFLSVSTRAYRFTIKTGRDGRNSEIILDWPLPVAALFSSDHALIFYIFRRTQFRRVRYYSSQNSSWFFFPVPKRRYLGQVGPRIPVGQTLSNGRVNWLRLLNTL